MKTPYELLVRFMPKATPAEEAEAQRLGVDVATYRAVKLEVTADLAKSRRTAADALPADVAAEEEIARRLRARPGLIKPRHTAPNIFVQAAETPGEVAKTVLFVFLYVVGLAAFVIVGGEKVQRMPGIFQCVLLGLLIIPVWWTTNRIWLGLGEGVRGLVRLAVRFWPLTLVAALFALGLLNALRTYLASRG